MAARYGRLLGWEPTFTEDNRVLMRDPNGGVLSTVAQVGGVNADNPVDWHPWGDEAFAAARERDVPVFLSVGYSACHWCHEVAPSTAIDGF